MPETYSKEFRKRAIVLALAHGGRPVGVAGQDGTSHFLFARLGSSSKD